MKILKVFGIVVGIHVFALILIFANPGCSSTTKPAPAPADTAAQQEAAPMITVPVAASAAPTITPVAFNPDAPAISSAPAFDASRFVPTRPNTPAASAVAAQPPENITPATTYTVKQGDSLWTLQKKFHINYKDIAAANNLKTSATLHEGQKLIIPSRSVAPAPAATAAAPVEKAPAKAETTKGNGQEFKYTVKSGETLGAIAQKFGVRVSDLAVRNNIPDPQKLRAGTEITIPGWRSTGPKSTARQSTESSAPATANRAPAPAPAYSPAAAPAPVPAESSAPAPVPSIQLEPDQPAPAATGNVPLINIDDAPKANPAP
jgi:LysM repeat protein